MTKYSNYSTLHAANCYSVLVPRSASRTLRSYFPCWLYNSQTNQYDARINNYSGEAVDREFFSSPDVKSFAVVRNPYHRLYSLFKSIRGNPTLAWEEWGGLTWPQFVEGAIEAIDRDVHFASPALYIPETTYIIKLENFEKGLQKFNHMHSSIAIDAKSVVSYTIGSTTSPGLLTEIMTPQLQYKIDQGYAADFERFGYENGCF